MDALDVRELGERADVEHTAARKPIRVEHHKPVAVVARDPRRVDPGRKGERVKPQRNRIADALGVHNRRADRQHVNRLAEQLAAGARTPRPFPMDAYRRGDEFVVSFDLPGMAPGAIDLTVEQNVLTIQAERRFDGQDGDQVIAAERLHGSFTRQLFLGETLDAERLVASYETGVLTLRIPVAESAKPRKVQISEGADERTIEAQTTQAGA